MVDEAKFEVPPGIIAITTYGDISVETSQTIMMMRARALQLGLNNVDFRFVVGTLVDKARNEAAMLLMQDTNLQWIWFIDADMVFQPELLDVMIKTAFDECKWADIVGAYCQLRGAPFLPTIDTGTGQWESHAPLQGPLEVIRTGAACVIVKRQVYDKLEFPWYGIRPAPRPLDMMAEFDNFCRIKFDGGNPFTALPHWESLLKAARDEAAQKRVESPDPRTYFSTVGEDSNLCDRAHAAGFRIVVQTNAVVGHADRKVIWPNDHTEAIQKIEGLELKTFGILA